MSDYKKTLNMPETAFEMKANLSEKEVKIQSEWALNKVEKKVYAKNKGKTPFILHDGPIYANGNIHVGHALNRIIKDIILRYKSMSGFYTKFIPGWDTHGLPIEQELVKKGLNIDKNLSVAEKRKNCKNFALENVYKQADQFRRLGMMSEMDEIYVTCDLDFEIRQLKIFSKMLQKKLIYQDLKPVYWSWSNQTALADAEIIYKDIESDSIYVSFVVVNGNDFVKKEDKIVIWTTTPYTIPCNLAVAVNPKNSYSKVKVGNSFYIVGTLLVETIANKLGWKNYEIVSEFLGKNIEGVLYKHPMYDKKLKIISDAYVSDKNGTGLVHNAPGFGNEDYLACKKHGIKPFCPIDDFGHFTADVRDKELVGVFYLKVNDIVIKRLEDSKNLLLKEKISHSHPHDWRTKKPVMYRATKQWFVNIEKIKKDISKALSKVKSTDKTVIPKIKEMVSSRSEWCISRQRIWGVPICIIYDKDGQPILDSKFVNHTIDVLNNEGINAWYREDAKYFLPEGYNTSKKYIKETDTMDVWFDSGTSYSVMQNDKLGYPADLYFEGKDQFRGWFNSSLITSVAAFGKSPYKILLTHGFVLDEKGNKMSKSLGNVVDPNDVCKEFGADILRIWSASVDYSDDVRISKNILEQNAEMYRRIRNTLFKFILGNLKDFDYKKMRGVKYSSADLYVLTLLNNDIKTYQSFYDKFDFKQIIKLVSLRISELSSWYFDYAKDILYCEKKNDQKRIAVQSVLYIYLDNYLKILSPIIPHTCEEAYSFFNVNNKQKSVHLEDFANYKLDAKLRVDLKLWNDFFNIKNAVYSELEKTRNEKIIPNNNIAKVLISRKEKLPFSLEEMAKYLGVSSVEFAEKSEKSRSIISVKIKNSKNIRCERCWNHYPKEMIEKDLCKRCFSVIKN
ncbi:MAG: isoleucine--tRNA ligase [Malacoplasma sp.]|nr:isoleucine--tRNA ligase [Malacoplasma sp.]